MIQIATELGGRYIQADQSVIIGRTRILTKPEISSGVSLLPESFNEGKLKLTDTRIPYSLYYQTLTKAIQGSTQITFPQKEVLIALVHQTISNSAESRSNLQKIMRGLGNSISINTLNHEFGKTLGPIAVISRQLLPIDPGSARILVPSRSSNPMVDFTVFDSSGEHRISLSDGSTTNLEYPSDVLKAIRSSKFYKNRWEQTPQYKVLSKLSTHSMHTGPISAGLWLQTHGYGYAFDFLDNGSYDEEKRQRCENTISKLTQEGFDISRIVSDSVNSKINHIKFHLSANGDMTWKLVETPQDVREKTKTTRRPLLISENSIGHIKSKMKLYFP